MYLLMGQICFALLNTSLFLLKYILVRILSYFIRSQTILVQIKRIAKRLLFRHTVLSICNRSCLGETYVDKELFTLLITEKIIESCLNFTILESTLILLVTVILWSFLCRNIRKASELFPSTQFNGFLRKSWKVSKVSNIKRCLIFSYHKNYDRPTF